MYIRSEIIRRVEITETVFERWYTEFYDYFSEVARPESLGRRRFTDEDKNLIEFIKKYAHEPYESIRTRLKEGQLYQPVDDQIKPPVKTCIMQKWQYAQLWIDREGWNFWVYEQEGRGTTKKIVGGENMDPTDQREIVIAHLGIQGWEMTGIADGIFFFKHPIE